MGGICVFVAWYQLFFVADDVRDAGVRGLLLG